MTTLYLKQCRPDAEETAYFWKLYHSAQRVEDRWCRNTVPEIAEALTYCSELSREQKLFLLRAWQVLVDDKGGFGRFMGAFDTYVHNVQDPADDCVAYKPELKRHIDKGYLLNTVEEAYNEARQRITELEQQLIKPLPIGELLQRLEDQTGEPWSEKYLSDYPLCVNLRKHSVAEVMHMSGFDRQYAEGWCSANDNAIHEIQVAGGVCENKKTHK